MAARICVHDLGLAAFDDGLFQSLNLKARIQPVGKPPGLTLARRPVHDDYQIQKAFAYWNVGDVSAPDLIGLRDCWLL